MSQYMADSVNKWTFEYKQIGSPVICVIGMTCAKRLEVIYMAGGGRGPTEGGSKDRLSNIGVGTENLVDAQMLVKVRHVS